MLGGKYITHQGPADLDTSGSSEVLSGVEGLPAAAGEAPAAEAAPPAGSVGITGTAWGLVRPPAPPGPDGTDGLTLPWGTSRGLELASALARLVSMVMLAYISFVKTGGGKSWREGGGRQAGGRVCQPYFHKVCNCIRRVQLRQKA